MKVEAIKDRVVFKSGYPTFGSDGHLSLRYDPTWDIYLGFKPSGILKDKRKLDYLA